MFSWFLNYNNPFSEYDDPVSRYWWRHGTSGIAAARLRGPLLVNIFGHTKIACGTLFLHFDHQRLLIFSQVYLVFFVILLEPSFLGRYSLVYHELLRGVLFPVVYILKFTCCTFSFRMCVEHFPCGSFFMFK